MTRPYPTDPSEGQHVCAAPDWCICEVTDVEPREKCHVHGIGEWPRRCAECGRFLPVEVKHLV